MVTPHVVGALCRFHTVPNPAPQPLKQHSEVRVMRGIRDPTEHIDELSGMETVNCKMLYKYDIIFASNLQVVKIKSK